MAHADVLIDTGKTWIDIPGEALEKRMEAFIPGPVNGARPKDKQRKLMGEGQSQFLPQQFAFPVR
jgi:hypothetical protein